MKYIQHCNRGMNPIFRKCLLPGLICSLSFKVVAQAPAADTAIRSSAITNAIKQYHKLTNAPSALYNGPEYIEYYMTIHSGHPFFDTIPFGNGSVLYDNVLYENVPLKFDLAKNEVILKDPSEIYSLTLVREKIAYFTVHGHKFIRVVKDESRRPLATGFYDLLYDGKSAQLLKKENKSVQTQVNQLDGIRNFIEHTIHYYIKTPDGYYNADSRSGVLNALKNKRPDIQQYIRSNKLSFKKSELEKTLSAITAYYDSISK